MINRDSASCPMTAGICSNLCPCVVGKTLMDNWIELLSTLHSLLYSVCPHGGARTPVQIRLLLCPDLFGREINHPWVSLTTLLSLKHPEQHFLNPLYLNISSPRNQKVQNQLLHLSFAQLDCHNTSFPPHKCVVNWPKIDSVTSGRVNWILAALCWTKMVV